MAAHHPAGGGPRSTVASGSRKESPAPASHHGGDGTGSTAAAGEAPEAVEVLDIRGGGMGLIDVLVEVSNEDAPAPAAPAVDGLEAAGLEDAAVIRFVAPCDQESPGRCAILTAAAARDLMARARAGFGRTALWFLQLSGLVAAANGGTGGGRRDRDSSGRAALFVMLSGDAADAAQDCTKKNANHHSSLSGVRHWLFFLVLVLLFGTVNSISSPERGANYTWFCPVPKYQFKRYTRRVKGWINETSLVLPEEQGTECKVPGHEDKQCKKMSASQKVVSGFGATFSVLGNLRPLTVVDQIVREIEEVDVTRRWLLTLSTFSFFSANACWALYLFHQACQSYWNFVPALLALIINFLYTGFFWCKASGNNVSREFVYISLFCFMGATSTVCLVGYFFPNLAGGFGIFFTVVAHLFGLLASGNIWSTKSFCITSFGITGNCLIFHKIDWKIELYYKIGSIIALAFRSLNMVMLLKLLFPRVSAFCKKHFTRTPSKAGILPDMSNGDESSDTHAPGLRSSHVQGDQLSRTMPSQIQSHGGDSRSTESDTHAPASTFPAAQNYRIGETMFSSDNIPTNSSVNGSLPSPKEDKANGNTRILVETKNIEENGGITQDSMYSQLKPKPPRKENESEDTKVLFEMKNREEDGNGNDAPDLTYAEPRHEDNEYSGFLFEKSNVQEDIDKPHGVVLSQLQQRLPLNEGKSEVAKVSFEKKNTEEVDTGTHDLMHVHRKQEEDGNSGPPFDRSTMQE